MRKVNTFLLLFLIFGHSIFANSGDFSDKEKAIIYTNSLQLLKNYEQIMNEIGVNVINDIEKAQSSAEALIELFINRQVLVYNDLDPSHQLSPFYEIETYASNLILWYPDGINISLNLDNARVGNIMEHENDVYSLDILVNKQMNGNYLNKTHNRSNEDLTFRIAFSSKNNSFDNFKIVGIRDAESKEMIDYSKALKDVNTEDLSKEELTKVYDGIKAILGDYNNFLALLGDPEELDEDKVFYRQSFTNLFENTETKIYNDINPAPEKSLIDINTYIQRYEENFQNGIKNIALNIDSAEFGKVIKSEEGDLYTYAYADKFFSGSFKGKEAFSEMFPLVFKVSFEKEGKAYVNYKISSIDISGTGFYTEAEEGEELATPDMVIKPVSRKGFLVKLHGSYGLSYINDENLSNINLQSDNHEWELTNDYGFSGGIGIRYNINDHLGLGISAIYNNYKAGFTLDGRYQDDEFSTDLNGDSFYKIVDASMDSIVNVDYISLPVYFNYTSSKPGKIGLFVDIGMNISYLLSSEYTVTGDYQYLGYYPGNPEVIRYLEIEELGFYHREYINEIGQTNATSFNVSLYGSFGISIPFGYYSSLMIGPEVMIGISDIMKERTDYTDIFGNTSESLPTKIQKFGIKIAFVYQL